MAEDNFDFISSQESLPLSQETFEFMWDHILPADQLPAKFVENIASCSGIVIPPDDIKAELGLDSSDLNNPTDALVLGSGIQSEMTQIENITVSSTQVQISQSASLVSYAPSSLPASQTWPGEYEFTVSFGAQEKNTKGVAWTYSEIKDKLYVGKDAPCPINFSTNSVFSSNDVLIRVMALYTSPEQVSEIVHRCVNHSMDELKNGVLEAEHLIRCESSMATYHVDAAGRHSILVPFENPQVGQGYSTYIYKFACFGSCAGGPNRRPLMLVFTLERNNQVIGRRKLDVKICACPGRDRKTEEAQCMEAESNVRTPQVNNRGPQKRKEPEMVTLSDVLNFTKSISYPPSKKKCIPNKDGHFILQVEEEECYEFLAQMKKFYEMCKMLEGLPPTVTKTLLNYQKKRSEKSD